LLRQRGGAFHLLARDQVLERGAQHRLRVDAAVVIEIGVLGRDDRVDQVRRHLALLHHDAPLDRVIGEADAVPVVDARDEGG
jgi:hypothetical protein